MPHKINNITACVAINEPDGDEGIMGFRDPRGQWFPLVASDRIRLTQIVQMAEQIKATTGIDYRVVRFSHREDITDEVRSEVKNDG